MVRLVVTPEQAEVLAHATENVELVDQLGNRLGYLTPAGCREEIELQEDLEIARRRLNSGESYVTFDEILERMKALEAK